MFVVKHLYVVLVSEILVKHINLDNNILVSYKSVQVR